MIRRLIAAADRQSVLILLLYATVATAIGHVDYHVRANPERGFAEYTPGVVAGTEPAPGRYRVLAPYAYEGLAALTGFDRRSTWVLFRWLTIFAALGATHWYLSTWFDRGPSVAGVLLTTALLPLTFTNSWAHPDHLMELFLFTWGTACIARGATALFAAVLVANALNRETSAFLVVLFWMAGPFDRRRLRLTVGLGLLWLSIHAGLRLTLGVETYDPWQWRRNLEFLALLPANWDPYYRAYAWFVVVLALPLIAAAASTWPTLPRVLRMSTAVVAPAFTVVALLFSSIIETRIFTPLLPLLAPAMVFALFAPRAAAAHP
ncbi:MAG: hypothetical protein IT184_07975 [Acidobacteria bacterium]|nr:hypothetical protein [Acidobacteriota bacterium]